MDEVYFHKIFITNPVSPRIDWTILDGSCIKQHIILFKTFVWQLITKILYIPLGLFLSFI